VAVTVEAEGVLAGVPEVFTAEAFLAAATTAVGLTADIVADTAAGPEGWAVPLRAALEEQGVGPDALAPAIRVPAVGLDGIPAYLAALPTDNGIRSEQVEVSGPQ
jgi:hypothetical protein